MKQHMALVVPEDELEVLTFENLMPPRYIDALYRTVKELEFVSLFPLSLLENLLIYTRLMSQ